MSSFMRAAAALVVLLLIVVLIGCGSGINRNNGLIAFQSGASPDIYVVNDDGSDQHLIIADGKEPALNPGRAEVAFARGGNIYSVALNGSGLTNITNHGLGVNASNPAFNHLGTRIAYVLSPTVPNAIRTIFVMDADGDNDNSLTPGDDPTFSPDDSQIIFVNQPDLYRIDADGSDLTRLTNHAPGELVNDPSFSPSGDRIVFEFAASGMSTPSLHSIEIAGLAESVFLDDAAQPSFRPLGNLVAFVRGGAVFSANVDGSGPKQLSAGHDDAEPDWSMKH